jgi:DNA-binding response OmpR family regulator
LNAKYHIRYENKILVLDDNNDLLEILTMLLTDFGYEVKPLSSGEMIFEEIKEFQPNLLIMDVMLAEMNGIDICKEIKENIHTALLPVILMSGSHDLTKIMEHPVAPEDFLAKPFDIDILLSKIEEHIKI